MSMYVTGLMANFYCYLALALGLPAYSTATDEHGRGSTSGTCRRTIPCIVTSSGEHRAIWRGGVEPG